MSVVPIATGVPNSSLSVTATFARPGSPTSWLASPSASNQTRPATLALRRLGTVTMFVTEAVSCTGSWSVVTAAVFVISV